MFYYFGYGSNLSVTSLRAKGVDPLSSEPAILRGWQLAFDIPDFFPIEGGTGNIRSQVGGAVHGVLHACRDADLGKLDALEALGVSYERIETSVVTYGGRRLRAYVYVGLADRVGGDGLPSERYRNIVVNGAVDMRLEPAYVDWLRSRPVKQRPASLPFEVPESLPQLTLDELASRRDWVGLRGTVFETSGADPRLDYLCDLLGGSDVTLLFLKRMDSSSGTETFSDVREGRFDEVQDRYLNAYLHEFAREFRAIGRLDYAVSPSSAPPSPSSDSSDTERPPPPGEGRWRPPFSGTDRHRRLHKDVPAAAVLRRAEDVYRAVGHENLGFLSGSWGFMPRDQPRRALNASHVAWDQAANGLTDMYRTLTVRRRMDSLPILDAGQDHLADGDLHRAASVLAILSHAYWYSQSRPPERLPEALGKPWATVRRRLGRGPEPVLSYIDLIVYNWRLVDPGLPDPMRVENLRLLTPTVDNAEERTFYLTQTEILARCAPVVAAAISAQAASEVDDREAVEAELMTIIGCLRQVVRESLLKIDPNPVGATHVDPVVWAKTVAPFAVPFVKGVLGPSGTSSPLFNFLDVFFGRKSFDSFLGDEIRSLRDSYPPLWRELLVALSQVDVGKYVRETEDANLAGLWREALDIYSGESGFLGRHRMKVYGYLELAFKVGRTVTIGGFSGLFDDRTWDQVDTELEASRRERLSLMPRACHHVRVGEVRSGDGLVPDGVAHVTLDVTGTGIHYEAGDRCGVLPESSPELIDKTLRALGADGTETVTLTPEWRAAVALRHGFEQRTSLTVAEVLRFGQIRPVAPRVAEALHALSQDRLLKDRMWKQQSHHWELWDLLEHLRTGGYDPSGLLASSEGSNDGLCRVVPPETFRYYSISSVMSRASLAEASDIELTVGQIAYRTEGLEGVADTERRGTASSFLCRAAGRADPISIIVRHPARFNLPDDPRSPVVMIAGGTGISPFRGFLVERARLRDAGPAFVFLGLRSREHFRPYEEELARSLAGGRTALHVAFSRDDVEVVWEPGEGSGKFVYRPAPRRRVPDVLLQGRTARELWALIRPTEEVNPAHVFVCGRAAFAQSVVDAFNSIFRRVAPGTDEERDAYARDTLTWLVGAGRLKLEIFSGGGRAEADSRGPIDVSEVVRHNHPDRGLWLVIEGRVYDISEFVRNHPGGSRVLEGYAGLDGTLGYERSHAGRSEIDAMREIYEIGPVRRLELGDEVLTAVASTGTTTTTLVALHRAWVRLAYLVVEMENALRNDQSLQHAVTTRDEPVYPRSALRLERALETHERFVESYLTPLARHRIPRLWERMHAVLQEGESTWMAERITRLSQSRDARYEVAARSSIQDAVRSLAESPDPAVAERLQVTFEALEALDLRFLAELKSALRDGLQVFERLQANTLVLGADQLLTSCRRMADVVAGYHEAAAPALRAHGWEGLSSTQTSGEEEPAIDGLETLHSSAFWEMMIEPDQGYVVLRRTPIAVEDIAQLEEENEKILACMVPEHRAVGIVVDMRQAQARNDAAFENAMRRVRSAVDERYARVAVLLESSVGVLQVNRLSRVEGSAQFATRSEASAVKFAMGTG